MKCCSAGGTGRWGWAAGSLPAPGWFQARQAGTPSWALTILLSLWEGRPAAVVSGLCLLVGSALGRKVEQSEYPLLEGCGFMCLLPGTFRT